jgi:hypothetical protein
MQWPDLLTHFQLLDGEITGVDNLTSGFDSIRAQNTTVESRGVYLLRVETPIPRVRSASDVIYIGQTEKGSDGWRWRDADTAAQENQLFYGYILQRYGPMTAWWADWDALNKAGLGGGLNEQKRAVLRTYFCSFLDWPPKNKPRDAGVF